MELTINLNDEELENIKKDFQNGKVYTDGCFCGTAISNFRGNFYVVLNFSCRKSMSCNNPYYQVNDVLVVKKALNYYSESRLKELLESDEYVEKIDDREFIVIDDSYNEPTVNDIYLVCDGFKFNDKSLKGIQKRLFKYYKNTYGCYSEVKFKDVGQFVY